LPAVALPEGRKKKRGVETGKPQWQLDIMIVIRGDYDIVDGHRTQRMRHT